MTLMVPPLLCPPPLTLVDLWNIPVDLDETIKRFLQTPPGVEELRSLNLFYMRVMSIKQIKS